MQYRGRAARIGKSRGGNVYVFSEERNSASDKIRQFLSKPVEDVFPPYLDLDRLEWIALLSCRRVAEKTKKAVIAHARDLLKNLLAFRNPQFRIRDSHVNNLLNSALKNLEVMGLLSIRRNKIVSTKAGTSLSKIDWVPSDSYTVLKTLKKLSSEKSDEKIKRWLLFTVCYIGLLKKFDRNRIADIIFTYIRNLRKNKNKLPPRNAVRGLAVSSLLFQWIDEASIEQILKTSTTGSDIVHDEDIRKLGNYASVEMRKIALLSEDLGYKKMADIAYKLAVRLKRGVKEDLVSKEPITDLSRLEDIGRRRSRLLHELGFRNLLDIYSLVFSKGEQAFAKKSKSPKELPSKIIEQLRSLVQSDPALSELCRKL